MTEHTPSRDRRSTASLLSELVTHVTGMVRKEVDLARAEVSENITRAGVAIGLLVAAVVVLLVAFNVLSAALVAGIANLGVDAGWAALIVGVIYLVIALVLVRRGTTDLKGASLAPTRTMQSVRRDAQTLKETMNGQR